MTPTSTQGTDRAVKSIRRNLAAGVGQSVLAGQAGVIYRSVAVQGSVDAAGSIALYHGAANTNLKTFYDAFMAANGGSNPTPGDWADQGGAAGEGITADVVGGNAKIVIFYIEISVMG